MTIRLESEHSMIVQVINEDATPVCALGELSYQAEVTGELKIVIDGQDAVDRGVVDVFINQQSSHTLSKEKRLPDRDYHDHPEYLFISDLDENGISDWLSLDAESSSLAVQRRGLGFDPGYAEMYGVGLRPRDLWVGDVNHDGTTEVSIVGSADQSLTVYTATSEGLLGQRVNIDLSINAVAVEGIELDLIEGAELAILSTDGVLAVYRYTQGGLERLLERVAPIGGNEIAVGDINGDGRDDLAASGTISDEVWVWFGLAEGGLSDEPVTLGPFAEPSSLIIRDLNEDGYDELTLLGYDEQNIYIFYGDEVTPLGQSSMMGTGLAKLRALTSAI